MPAERADIKEMIPAQHHWENFGGDAGAALHRSRVTQEELEASRRVTPEQLQDKFDRMQLVNEALWEIVKAFSGATDDNLREWISHLDAADGQTDGRRVHRAEVCTSCESRVPIASTVCVFCSAPAPAKSPFAF